MIVVKTPKGYVSSFRPAWWRSNGDPVWTWRTDGAEAHDFGTEEEARSWVGEVWQNSTPKERAESGWAVEVVT